VRVGEEPAKSFLAQLHDANTCTVEHELFMRLSVLADKRFCNCAIYQFELMDIIKAFLSDRNIPPFPIELGTTEFGMPRPSPTRILINRLRRPFTSRWLWWKARHIRRENLLKYGKAAKE
jgi:hypothetical protein